MKKSTSQIFSEKRSRADRKSGQSSHRYDIKTKQANIYYVTEPTIATYVINTATLKSQLIGSRNTLPS